LFVANLSQFTAAQPQIAPATLVWAKGFQHPAS
jgi:hypothetical protein